MVFISPSNNIEDLEKLDLTDITISEDKTQKFDNRLFKVDFVSIHDENKLRRYADKYRNKIIGKSNGEKIRIKKCVKAFFNLGMIINEEAGEEESLAKKQAIAFGLAQINTMMIIKDKHENYFVCEIDHMLDLRNVVRGNA